MLDYFANPSRFNKIAAVVEPIAWGVVAVAFPIGVYLAFIASPADYQQGETVRIMYIHVPSAWMAIAGYLMMAVAALSYLVWKHPLADIGVRAMALPGCVLTAITLITGSLWGKPMWGTWWVWDARLTSMLILLFLYIGYIVLAQGFERYERGSKSGSVLLLVGVINLPIIKFSVDWWNTLHQGASVLRLDGALIDPSMLRPLLVMALAVMAWFIALTLMRMRTMLAVRRFEILTRQGIN